MDNRFKIAMDIQDACNLTAVAGIFHKICLQVLEEKQSTIAVCKDSAIIWIADKIYDLVHRPDAETLSKAYQECMEKQSP